MRERSHQTKWRTQLKARIYLFGILELTAISNDHRSTSLPTPRSDGFDLLYNVHAVTDMSKDDVFAIKPVGFDSAEEKL